MEERSRDDRDPRHHTHQVRQRLQDMTQHLREDVAKVNDPRARALFETTAEVLEGLDRAYEHYERQSEEAWR
jgi:hypothetical protein